MPACVKMRNSLGEDVFAGGDLGSLKSRVNKFLSALPFLFYSVILIVSFAFLYLSAFSQLMCTGGVCETYGTELFFLHYSF